MQIKGSAPVLTTNKGTRSHYYRAHHIQSSALILYFCGYMRKNILKNK